MCLEGMQVNHQQKGVIGMQSVDLSFPNAYLYGKEDQLFDLLTKNYIFRCDNYAVAYQLMSVLDHIKFCEYSMPVDDCWWPYSWLIFFTCMPKDVERICCVAKRIPSSISANIKILNEEEEVIFG